MAFAGVDFGPGAFGAGAGFFPSQGADDASRPAPRGAPKESLRAVTVRQLLKASHSSDIEAPKVDGMEITTVTLVGRVDRQGEVGGGQIAYDISDHGNTIQVHQHHSGVENAEQALEGRYIRVYGSWKRLEGQVVIQAHAVKPLESMDEITAHYLRVVFEHLHLTKGDNANDSTIPPEAAAAKGGLATGGFGNPTPAGAAAALGLNSGHNQMGGPYQAPGAPSDATPCARAVEEALRSLDAPGSQGATFEQVFQRLGGTFSEMQVRTAFDFLSNEGIIYTTCDDEHWRVG